MSGSWIASQGAQWPAWVESGRSQFSRRTTAAWSGKRIFASAGRGYADTVSGFLALTISARGATLVSATTGSASANSTLAQGSAAQAAAHALLTGMTVPVKQQRDDRSDEAVGFLNRPLRLIEGSMQSYGVDYDAASAPWSSLMRCKPG
jgi:hypothetical protein